MTTLTRNDRLQFALERLDAAIARQQDEVRSRQSRFTMPTGTEFFRSVYSWLKKAEQTAPAYAADSRHRDRWLRNFWRQEPHLAGVINTVVSIDKNRGWWLTGGRNQVRRYENILRDAEDGQGWRYFISSAALSYYTADIGAVIEIGRDSAAGQDTGPMRALYNVDPVACRLTGNPETPLAYYDTAAPHAIGDGQLWGPADYFRAVPLPSNDQALHGLGYCAVSRVLDLAQIMMAVYEHDKEKLGARAPKGLLMLSNIAQDQWVQAMKARTAQLEAKEREFFDAVAVIAQMGSEAPDAKLVALSQLPDGFDIEVMTNLLMYAYALCFGYDPIEFWPVESGALGRGRETDIQHRKGTSKGGMEFVFSMQDRLQQELPPTLLFQFEERDVSGELMDAQVHKAWAEVAKTLTEAMVLTPQQAASYLADKGVIPTEWTEHTEDASVDDEGVERSIRRLRDEAIEQEPVRRAIAEHPDEPIIRLRFNPATGTTREIVLWDTGDAARKRRLWAGPVAHPAGAIDRPRDNRPIVARATLFEGDGVTITDEDVDAAIAEGGQRLGAEFAGLLMAEPEEGE